MLKKLKSLGSKTKVALMSTALTMAMAVPAFATESDTATQVNSALTSGFDEVKTIFLGVIAGVIGAGMALFAIKWAVNQGVSFFSRISKKS